MESWSKVLLSLNWNISLFHGNGKSMKMCSRKTAFKLYLTTKQQFSSNTELKIKLRVIKTGISKALFLLGFHCVPTTSMHSIHSMQNQSDLSSTYISVAKTKLRTLVYCKDHFIRFCPWRIHCLPREEKKTEPKNKPDLM